MRKCPICGGFDFKYYQSNRKPLPHFEKAVRCIHCDTVVYLTESVVAYRKFDFEENKMKRINIKWNSKDEPNRI